MEGKKIVDYLDKKGFKHSLKGFGFLVSAISICVDNPEAINYITKNLYPAVAKAHGTTPSRAEREQCDTQSKQQTAQLKLPTVNLSQGQKTILFIVRRLAKMPNTLILDKPLTNRQQQIAKLHRFSRPRPYSGNLDFALESFKAGIRFTLKALEDNCDG